MQEYEFDNEPQFEFEEQPSKDTSLLGQAKEFGTNLAGGAMAGIDMLASTPGLVGAGAAAATAATGIGDQPVTTGRSPNEFLGEIMQSAQEGNPLNMLPEKYTALRNTTGYEVANKFVGDVFNTIGQGYGNIAGLLSDEKNAEKVGELTDALVKGGLLAGGLVAGGKAVKPGSLEFNKTNAPIHPETAPSSDSGGTLNYLPGQKGEIQKTGTLDTTLTTPDIPAVEPDKLSAYTYKNKQVLDSLAQYDYRKGSDIPGIDFTTFSLEDPKQLEHLQGQLKNLGIDGDINQVRTLASQMQDKVIAADEEAKRMAHTISRRTPPLAVSPDNIIAGYKKINSSPMNNYVELVDTRLMELMRHYDRLTNPKGLNQFLEKENSVLNNGLFKGLTLSFWPEEGKIVQSNGNTRRGVAAKHGMMEIPTYVRVLGGRVPEEFSKAAVSIPGLKWEGSEPKGQLAKPSEIGLPTRTLNEGVFNPQVKYAPDPTVSTVKIPKGTFQNNFLWSAQAGDMPSMGARQGIQLVAERSSVPWYRQVAKLLLDDKEFNPNFSVRDKFDPSMKTGENKQALGRFFGRDYNLAIRRDQLGNEYVFMHEAIHGRTQGLIEKLIQGKLDRMHPSYDATKRMVELWQSISIDAEILDTKLDHPQQWGSTVKDMDKWGQSTQSPLAKIVGQYGLTNAHEFVAEAFTNAEFQNLLKQISLPSHMQTKGFRYYWDSFVETLSNMMGIKRGDNNYLAATLEAGAEMMRTSDKKDRMFFALEQKPMEWQPRAVGLERAPDFVSDMVENKKIGEIDRRPLQDVINEKQIDASSFKDLDNGTKGSLLEKLLGGAKLLGRQLADARTIDMLNKTVEGAGDLISNISGRTFLIDRWIKSQIEETLHGKEYAAHKYDPRGFVHRLGSRDGVNPTFDALGTKDGAEMLKTWLPNIGKKELFRSDFANDKQWKAYNTLQNQLDRALGIINGLRTEAGKPVVDRVMSYFPASRGRGDYKVLMKDGMGNDVNLSLFENEFEAAHYVKKMREAFPYIETSDPFHREPYKVGETDYTVWDEAERINSGNHELTQLIQRAKADYFTRMGMGGHLLKRRLGEDIGGYKGSDFNPKEAREGLQDYFEYLYNHAGNLSKGLVEKELNELSIAHEEGPKPLSVVAPNLSEYLHQFLDKSRGAHNTLDQSEQMFFGEITKRLGLGESAPQRGMAKLSRAAMVWYLFKAPFFASQPFQTFNALPHLVDMKGSVAEAGGHFLQGWQRTFFPDEQAKSAVNWAVKNEYLDPTTQHLLDDYKAAVPTRVFLRTSGFIERELVRTPAFLAFEHALRDTIPDSEKRYEAAAEKMAYSMSMTNRSNSPLVWEKLGIIGQGMRQLKSYSTNIWGQFAYFAKEAGVDHNYKPLGTFLATEALIGGVKGTIGIAEATALITAWNYMTSSTVRTPEEWMLTEGAPDAATYGLASTVLGRDISNQVGNPTGFNYFDPIPFKFAFDIAKQNLEYAVAAGQGQLTDSIRLKTWLANTPTGLHEAIKNWWTNPGQPVPNPNINMQGTYYRDKGQTAVSTISGTRTVEETKADALQRFFKQHEQHITTNRGQLQNSMVDDIMGGKGVDSKKIQEYMFQGGDVKNLAGDLKNTMIQRHRSAIFNELTKSKSPANVQKFRDVAPYMRNQPPNIYPSQSQEYEFE